MFDSQEIKLVCDFFRNFAKHKSGIKPLCIQAGTVGIFSICQSLHFENVVRLYEKKNLLSPVLLSLSLNVRIHL